MANSTHWRPRDPVDGGLADECDAFLTGRYAEYRRDVGQPIPAWAWINELAHRDPEDIVVLAIGDREPGRVLAPWTPVVDDLAGSLAAQAGSLAEMGTMQRAALVPLELSVIETGQRLTPKSLYLRVQEALESYWHFAR